MSFRGSIRVGSILGIPIRIHVTFLLVLPFLAIAFGRIFSEAARAAGLSPGSLSGPPILWGLAVAIALFLSVLVHELAHSLYARRHGARVRDITLLMIGGVSQISEPPRTGREEAIMALVGPLASLVLGAAFWLVFRALRPTGWFNGQFVAFQLSILNLGLGVFNLLPAFPMDGGRVLRGFAAERWGIVPATRLAAGAGRVFAVLFAIVGFLSANFLLVFVAFFVYFGAEAESRGVIAKALLGEIRVRDLLASRAPPVEAATSLYELGERMLRERRVAYPAVAGGTVLGVVTLDDVRRVPLADRGRVSVGDVVRPVAPLDAGADAVAAIRALGEAGGPVPVVDDGMLVGVIAQIDVARSLELMELAATQHPPPSPGRGGLRPAEQRG